VAGISERVIGHVESMEADEILSRSSQVEKIGFLIAFILTMVVWAIWSCSHLLANSHVGAHLFSVPGFPNTLLAAQGIFACNSPMTKLLH
jgi:hypothetical protein